MYASAHTSVFAVWTALFALFYSADAANTPLHRWILIVIIYSCVLSTVTFVELVAIVVIVACLSRTYCGQPPLQEVVLIVSV